MPHKDPTLVDIIEDVAQEVSRRMVEDIEWLRKLHGPRPAFTTKMTPDEKMVVWMETEAAGPQGWIDFYQARRDEGLTNETAQYEMMALNEWAQKRLGKDPSVLEDENNGTLTG